MRRAKMMKFSIRPLSYFHQYERTAKGKCFTISGANNLIPMEIALKIANKIRARERFSVYIVVPMWPEGVPTSTPTQRILFWQVYHDSGP